MTGEQDTYVCVMHSFNGFSKYTICIQEQLNQLHN